MSPTLRGLAIQLARKAAGLVPLIDEGRDLQSDKAAQARTESLMTISVVRETFWVRFFCEHGLDLRQETLSPMISRASLGLAIARPVSRA